MSPEHPASTSASASTSAAPTAVRPSPAITAAHAHVHLPQRRFIGPLPAAVLGSERAERERALRAKVVERVTQALALEPGEGEGEEREELEDDEAHDAHGRGGKARLLRRDPTDAGLVRTGDGGNRDWLKGKALEGHERRRARRAAAMNNILGLADEDDAPTPRSRWGIFPWRAAPSAPSPGKGKGAAGWTGESFLIGGDLHAMHAAGRRTGMDPDAYASIGKGGEVRAGKSGDEEAREMGGHPSGPVRSDGPDGPDGPKEVARKTAPELKPAPNDQQNSAPSKGPEHPDKTPSASRLAVPRRPSYGSRSTGMQSFTTARTHLNASTEPLGAESDPDVDSDSENSGTLTPRPLVETSSALTASPPSMQADTLPHIPHASLRDPGAAPQPGHASVRTSASDGPDTAGTNGNENRNEASSSRKHLLHGTGELGEAARPCGAASVPAGGAAASRDKSRTRGMPLPERLKSAMKRSSSRKTDSLADGRASLDDAGNKASRKRGKSVQFPRTTERDARASPGSGIGGSASPAGASDLEPANPREVLARSGDEVEGTSAGAVQEARRANEKDQEQEEREDAAEVLPGHVVLKDRMLVRVCHNRDPGLMVYDEEIERRKPCARVDRFEEYLVVYRQGKIELYSEWKIPFKEKYLQTKRLCYTIPLQKGRTNLSIYTHADLTMCLSVDARPFQADLEGRHGQTAADLVKRKLKQTKQMEWLKRGGGGTEIFMLLHKERDRATDWCWEIWRELGGELPTTLDVMVPALQMTVRLPMPTGDYLGDTSQFGTMSRQGVIKACEKALGSLPTFQRIKQQRESETGEVVELALAWQTNGRLDWVTQQQDLDVEGRKRYWSVLGGFGTMPTREISQLEIRPVHHLPTSLRLTDGKSLDQPPDVEGFLSRVNDTVALDVYLFSYAGNIFSAPVKGIRTPFPVNNIFDNLPFGELAEALVELHLRRERARAVRNLQRTSGYLDFRDIERLEALAEDANPKKGFRFQVTLRTGEELVMQAHNAQVRDEWVERLGQLQRYWTTKQRVEARQKMEAMGNFTRNDGGAQEAQAEDPAYRPQLYNWCALEQCSPVLHAGRLFVKRATNRQFRSSYCLLTRGYLMQYKIRRATAYHHIQHKYSLQQAYVYSGLLAQNEITSITREDPFKGEARVYQDGLECADGAEDCTFALWIRGKDRHFRKGANGEKEFKAIPLGKDAQRMLVFRARSKLERDVWLWALQLEIERQAHDDPARVVRERTSGLVPEKN